MFLGNKKSIKVILALLLGFGVHVVMAGSSSSFDKSIFSSWVVTLSSGPTWDVAVGNQTFFIQPEIQKTYVTRNRTDPLGFGELFLGFQHLLYPNIQGQLGVAVGATSTVTLSGDIWDDAYPEFNNYTYAYKISHSQVALKGALFADIGHALKPYLSASVGAGFNRATDYSGTPTIFEAMPTPNFASHTKTTFTYTVGVGLQREISKHWQIGAGYEFADWGQSNLARAPGQTLNTGLLLRRFCTNGLQFNVSYLA